MRIENVELRNGAVIIADVHYKKGDKEFLSLLKKWIKNPPPQVFLLGDIFHLLLPFEFLIDYNKEAINLINKLSQKTEVYYTPGNHDFNIQRIFPGVIFADSFADKEYSVFLTHGDLTDTDLTYKIYVKLIRNNIFEAIVNFITFNFINSWMFKKLLRKNIKCDKIEKFEIKVKEKIKKIDYDIIIEGHYHQSKKINIDNKIYINLPAFICNKKYILIQLDNKPIIKEMDYDG